LVGLPERLALTVTVVEAPGARPLTLTSPDDETETAAVEFVVALKVNAAL